jgi:hypothetical protein
MADAPESQFQGAAMMAIIVPAVLQAGNETG